MNTSHVKLIQNNRHASMLYSEHCIDVWYFEQILIHNTYGSSLISGNIDKDDLNIPSLAAGFSAALTCAAYNPLDTLRIRWQVTPSSDMRVSDGLLRFGADIIKQEGIWKGLWKPGIIANMAGMGMSSAIRFGYYESVRDIIARRTAATDDTFNLKSKSPMPMFTAGLICGCLGYMSSTPFHLLKTKIQGDSSISSCNDRLTGLVQGSMKLVSEGGIASLWRGSLPLGMRGSFFTAGQMLGK